MIDTSLSARLLRGTTAGFVLLVGAASFPSLAAENGDEAINPHAGDPAAIARGADLFAARCVFCHGGQGRGAKGPALTAGHFKRGGSDMVLFSTIATGRPGTQMGAFGSTLSPDDIWDIIAYLGVVTKKREESGDLPPS
jgi:mono/diheme cytochrome c family protein